jgi:two-component system chemotaxis response regulator CheY
MLPTKCHDKRLLLVEDDFASRELLSMILAGEGYRVAAAANGAEGLERLHDHDRPCLILLDLNMPVMDGRTFCARRQEDHDLDGIPVVVMSSAGDVAEQAAALGAAHYLQKPLDTVRLLDAVRQCCP